MTEDVVWQYLSPRVDDFWRWEEQGDVVAWKEQEGGTIAFRAELINILERLAPSGLPPLSAVLLMLAACRDEWHVATCRSLLDSSRPDAHRLAEQVFQGLIDLRNLPRDLRTTSTAREELAAQIFEQADIRCTPESSASIVRQLRAGLPEVYRAVRTKGRDYLYAALGQLANGLPRVSAEKLRLRVKTGVDDIPVLAELALPCVAVVRSLLQTHSGDEVIGGVVRLTKRVLAALSLPRPLSDHHDLPMGGVSDITNRGSLDRLLISELAHDDLTLAVRVAVNEALYLRRETPPRARPRARTILIDQGIRTWGLPRVYSAAIATALAAAADLEGELSVFRTGPKLQAVDLSTRAGLIELLEQLEIERHPGELLAEYHERATSVGAGDHVLITTADTLADREFAPFLQSFTAPLFVVAVERDGGLTLLQRSAAGIKTLRELKLSLDDVTAVGGERPAPPLAQEISPRPAALREKFFPLRLPLPFVLERSWRIPPLGVLQTTKDGRLMLHSDSAVPYGARQIADRLPGSAILWARPRKHGFSAVIGALQQGNVALFNFDEDSGSATPIPLPVGDEHLLGVSAHGETLFLIYPKHVSAYSLPHARQLDVLDIPDGAAWRRQRFFRSRAGQWLALAHNGERTVFEPLLSLQNANTPPIWEVFESDSIERPLALVWPFQLYFTGDSRRVAFQHNGKPIAGELLDPSMRHVRLSKDTRRVVLPARCPSSSKLFAAFVLRLPEIQLVHETFADQFLEPAPPRAAASTHPTLRVHFTHIGIRLGEGLMLRPRRGPWMHLSLNRSARRLQLRPCRGDLQPQAVRSFEQCGFDPKRMQEARWENGLTAFLDHRGLLHLAGRSPEVTLVLDEAHVSGWIQHQGGLYFGNSYFAGKECGLSAFDALERFIQPWIEELGA